MLECIELRICSQCHEEKTLDNFYKQEKYKDGYTPRCKKCIAKYNKWWAKNNPEKIKQYSIDYRKKKVAEDCSKFRFYQLKGEAKKRGLSCDISEEDFIIWYDGKSNTCAYCNIPLDILRKLGKTYSLYSNRFSIDRMDNSKGYGLDNIVLACFRCNYVKSDLFSYDEMKDIIGPLMSNKWESLGREYL